MAAGWLVSKSLALPHHSTALSSSTHQLLCVSSTNHSGPLIGFDFFTQFPRLLLSGLFPLFLQRISYFCALLSLLSSGPSVMLGTPLSATSTCRHTQFLSTPSRARLPAATAPTLILLFLLQNSVSPYLHLFFPHY